MPGRAREVVIVVFDDVQLLDVAGPGDVFDAANRIAGRPAYRVRTGACGDTTVTASNGLRLQADCRLREVTGRIDTLLVAGGWGSEQAVEDPELVAFVRDTARRARRVASVCTGAFVLAEAGVLAGRRATTHWSQADKLAAYDGVEVAPDRLFVSDGPVSTSAGVTAGIDLALALVEDDLGAEVARSVCRWLVVFLQRPGGQSQFSQRVRRPAVTSDPIRTALDVIAADPAGDYRVEVLAAAAGLSLRHFAREFRRQTGLTPAAYVEVVRIEAAQDLLVSSDDTLPTVAARAGFGSEEGMRQAFRRRLGVAPGQYRARFRNTEPRLLPPAPAVV